MAATFVKPLLPCVHVPQDFCRWSCEQLIIDVAGTDTVATSGFSDAHQTCHSLRTSLAAIAERDLPQDDQRTQRTLG